MTAERHATLTSPVVLTSAQCEAACADSLTLTKMPDPAWIEGMNAVNPAGLRFRREVTMAPPPMDTQITRELPSDGPSSEAMERANEIAKRYAKPFELSQEDWQRVKTGVLVAMGRSR